MKFEWDEAKARSNLEKHGVSFELARRVFVDPLCIEQIDDRSQFSGEERWITIGVVNGTELQVVTTIRGDATRIISARRAEKHEREDYWKDRDV